MSKYVTKLCMSVEFLNNFNSADLVSGHITKFETNVHVNSIFNFHKTVFQFNFYVSGRNICNFKYLRGTFTKI